MRHLLLIGSAALVLAVITAQWVTRLPAAAKSSTAGVSLDNPPPWSPQEPGRVVSVAMGGPAARAGLRKGDRVQAINGIPNWSYYELHRLFDNSRAGDSLEYTVLRGNQTRVVPLRPEGRLGKIWVDLLINAFAAGVFFGVGVFVYWKHPKDRRALTFFWMCLPLAFMFSLGNIADVNRADFTGPTTRWIVVALLFLFLPPLLHFTLIFPKPRSVLGKYPGVVVWIYSLPALIAVSVVGLMLLTISLQVNPNLAVSIVQALSHLVQGRPLVSAGSAIGLLAAAAFLIWKLRSTLLSRPLLSISALYFAPFLFGLALVPLSVAFGNLQAFWKWGLIGAAIALTMGLIAALLPQLILPVAACVSLFRNYRDAGVTEKQQLRWPLWGTVTAVAGSFLLFVTLSVLDSLGPVSIPAGWLTTLFLLPIPTSFAFAIAKYRLMDNIPTLATAGADARIPQPELP
jgi:hypothetical protein